MERRERVLTALKLEEPDRVPTHTIYLDANNVDNILGKPLSTDFDLLEQTKSENPDNWPEKLSDLLESVETSIFSRCVEAAIEIQRRLINAQWPAGLGPLRVRMGIHTGEAQADGSDDYVSTHTLNRVARICSVGHGGQILIMQRFPTHRTDNIYVMLENFLDSWIFFLSLYSRFSRLIISI